MSRRDPEIDRDDVLSREGGVTVTRYTRAARINHWVTAFSLIALALSGLALFHPSLFFLTGLFGGGQATRAIHPYIGVVLAISFTWLFFRFVRLNLPAKEDAQWVAQIGDVLKGEEEKLPEIGKYNAGQKFVFWAMSVLIVVLFVTGLAIWERWFAEYLTIEQRRWAVLIHAVAAVAAICVWIMHVYASYWVKGTMSAMTTGKVTGGWAYRHHRKWLKALAREPKPTAEEDGHRARDRTPAE